MRTSILFLLVLALAAGYADFPTHGHGRGIGNRDKQMAKRKLVVSLISSASAASPFGPQGPATPGSVLYTNGTNTFWTRIGQSIGGTSGNQTIAIGTTTYWPLYGNGPTNQLVDSTCGTRSLLTEPTILTNLFFYASGPAGVNKSNVLTIMTNGISTTMTATIGGPTQTKATNLLEYLTIPAGTEVGVRIVTQSGGLLAPVKFSWAISLKQ